jgi:thiol:disulfide interchange protein
MILFNGVFYMLEWLKTATGFVIYQILVFILQVLFSNTVFNDLWG